MIVLLAAGVATYRWMNPPQVGLTAKWVTTSEGRIAPYTADQIVSSRSHPEPGVGVAAINSETKNAGAAPLSPTPIHATDHDLAQARILDEILATRNDNDPRMDKELRKLSPEAKHLMRARYAATHTEQRNERGTIVFLVGRELNTPEDLAFLHSVLKEKPCRSLENCDRDEQGPHSPDHQHLEGPNEVTLAYPQFVALKAIETYLESSGRNPALSEQAISELEAARHSPVRKIANLAEEILRKIRASRSVADH